MQLRFYLFKFRSFSKANVVVDFEFRSFKMTIFHSSLYPIYALLFIARHGFWECSFDLKLSEYVTSIICVLWFPFDYLLKLILSHDLQVTKSSLGFNHKT